NQPNVLQMPMDAQLAIALYHFGHYGNAISATMAVLWAGIESGTITTLLCPYFWRAALYWPTGAEREETQQWDKSCPAWKDWWVLVDGTLVPLYSHHGKSWYDCNTPLYIKFGKTTRPPIVT
ncbi:hypothetical protein PAXRUDRAFT_155160, partial [Paxillus rubicundulus Ve08.2h10]